MNRRDNDDNDQNNHDMIPEDMVDEEEMQRERRAKALTQWQRLRAGTLDPSEVLGALRAIGKARLIEARGDVAPYLHAEDSEERRTALTVLGLDFGLAEYAATALDFLQHDPDVDCRLLGADVVGALRANSGETATLAALARVVRTEDEDPFVRKAAYSALLAVIAYDPRQQFTMATSRFHFPEDVDWALVDRYRPDAP